MNFFLTKPFVNKLSDIFVGGIAIFASRRILQGTELKKYNFFLPERHSAPLNSFKCRHQTFEIMLLKFLLIH